MRWDDHYQEHIKNIKHTKKNTKNNDNDDKNDSDNTRQRRRQTSPAQLVCAHRWEFLPLALFVLVQQVLWV